MNVRPLLFLLGVSVACAAEQPATLLSSKIVSIADEAEANGGPGAKPEVPPITAKDAEIARLEAQPPTTIPIQGDALHSAIATVATAAGMNFIAPDKADFPDEVTLVAKQNPWHLLNVLAKRYRFSIEYQDGLWIFNREQVGALVAKTYKLKNTNLEVYKASQNSFSSVGQITNMSGGSSGPEGGMVFTAQTSKIVEDIRDLLGLPLTAIGEEGSEGGKRAIEGKKAEGPQSGSGAKVLYLADRNAVYVVCTKDQHLVVANYLKEMDVKPRQIQIVASFYETAWDPKTVLGINPENAQPSISLQNIQATVNLSNLSSRSEPATLRVSDMAIQVNALQTDKNSKLVQNPSVTTDNNREVYFSVGDEEPFVSANNIYAGVPNAGFGAAQANVSIRRIGTTINIIPMIFDGDGGRPMIRLRVRIEVGALKGFRQLNNLNVPVVSSQKFEYQRYVNDNQVLAFGGLAGIGENDGVTKVPIAGDVPIVGYLFKSKSREIHQRNLVAYIVARVVDDDATHTELPALNLRDPQKAAATGKQVFPK